MLHLHGLLNTQIAGDAVTILHKIYNRSQRAHAGDDFELRAAARLGLVFSAGTG
jgi:hypothetical protein